MAKHELHTMPFGRLLTMLQQQGKTRTQAMSQAKAQMPHDYLLWLANANDNDGRERVAAELREQARRLLTR